MSNAVSVYKEIVSRYSDIVHDTWKVASAPQALPLAAAPQVRVQIRLQLELASPITVVPNLSIHSVYALTVCALLRWSRLEVYMGQVIVV